MQSREVKDKGSCDREKKTGIQNKGQKQEKKQEENTV